MEHHGVKIGRKELLANLENKIFDKRFLTDAPSLLRAGLDYDHSVAYALVSEKLIVLLAD